MSPLMLQVDDGPASFRSIDGTNEGPPPAKARSEAAAPHGAYAAANAQPCDLVDFPSPLFLLAADLMMVCQRPTLRFAALPRSRPGSGARCGPA